MCVYTFLSSVSCEIVIAGVVFNATFGSFLGFCEGFSSTTSIFLFPRKSDFFFSLAFTGVFEFYSLEDRFPQFMATEFLVYVNFFLSRNLLL